METPKIFESELRFCEILWQHEPVKSSELVRLCAQELGWKKSTTYTVIKRLTERGIVQTRDAMVTAWWSSSPWGCWPRTSPAGCRSCCAESWAPSASAEAHCLAILRVAKGQGAGEQGDGGVAVGAVFTISPQGPAPALELHPDLVRPSRVQPDAKQRQPL